MVSRYSGLNSDGGSHGTQGTVKVIRRYAGLTLDGGYRGTQKDSENDQ